MRDTLGGRNSIIVLCLERNHFLREKAHVRPRLLRNAHFDPRNAKNGAGYPRRSLSTYESSHYARHTPRLESWSARAKTNRVSTPPLSVPALCHRFSVPHELRCRSTPDAWCPGL